MALPLPIRRSATRRSVAAIATMLLVVLSCGQARPDDGPASNNSDCTQYLRAAALWNDYCDPGIVFLTQPPGPQCWTIDYRIQPMFDSRTSYQFGTAPQLGGPQYAPISKLDWSLDSTWTGVRIGLQKPNWDFHFEWLTPMGPGVAGSMDDYDWNGPARDPCSLSVSPERWLDGQKIEFEADYRCWSQCFLGLPLELWPLAGFRFQRFDMMAHNGLQVINTDLAFNPVPIGYQWPGDMGSFNQQYYIGYLGAQLRGVIAHDRPTPIYVTLQADYGATAGYNIDHHISGYEDAGVHRYTMESTDGGTLHFAIILEAPISPRVSLGLQGDHLEINTTGSHRWVETGNVVTPVDETWSNGVSVVSRQSALTVFLRVRI